MENNKIAFIGDKNIAMIYHAVGCDVFSPPNADKTRQIVNKLLTTHSVVLIVSRYAKFVEDIIEDSKNAPYPIFLVMPENCDEHSYGIDRINKNMEKSLGVKLSFEEDKNGR